ncbi:hypothetical protein RSAG8_09466, partial [Rhizoctonia solani AG-8 WAC10335]
MTGRFVRIGPNHISIADPGALETVYGHSNGLLKSEFYNAFHFGETRDLLNVRDKAIHTTKRKRIANIFSPQNVLAFEPRVQEHIQRFCAQLDMRCEQALQGASSLNWDAKEGRPERNTTSVHFSYLSFDIISDLALGVPFGMVEGQKDSTPPSLSLGSKRNVQGIPVIRLIATGGKTAMALGSHPAWVQTLLFFSAPWYIPDLINRRNFLNTTRAAVDARVNKIENGGPEDKDRGVPPGKTLTIAGETFNEGSVISVPSYSTNRSSVWGPDPDTYRPERWLEDSSGSLNKYFVAFSTGPRACVGRNLANMNLMLVSAAFFHRYDVQLASSTTKLQVDEGIIRGATHCEVSIKRRV